MEEKRGQMTKPGTICDLFFSNVTTFDKSDAFISKRDGCWKSISTREFKEAVESLAIGLKSLGLSKGDRVALLSENRPEWLVADFAILTIGCVTVPIYPTLNARDTAYIVGDSDAVLAVVSCASQAEKLLAQQASIPKVRDMVLMDPGKERVEGFISMSEIQFRGREKLKEKPGLHEELASRVEPGDLASIVYTSGTTGVPKGVMLSQGNFSENFKATLKRFQVSKDDLLLSFLPLSHVFERLVEFLMFSAGASIAYAENFQNVADNIVEVRPTIMASVPRLFEKVYAKILDQASQGPGIKKVFVHYCVRICREWAANELEAGAKKPLLNLAHALVDALFSRKLRKKMGGRLRFFASGGGPLARDLGLFYYGAGIPIAEGYGLTESSPIIAVNRLEKLKFGSVGPAIDKVEVRLEEDGELLVRGPNIMLGYHKLPDATAEAMTADGWLRTGDIAEIDGDGYIFITDRKKELIVTAGGKKVAPQPIENLLKMNKYVSMAMVVGDRKPYPAALVAPNWQNVTAYAERKGVKGLDRQALCRHPQIWHLFTNVLARANVHLSRFEQVKRCRLLERDFSLEEGELTPTMKLKRRVIIERCGALIEEMYASREDWPDGGNS